MQRRAGAVIQLSAALALAGSGLAACARDTAASFGQVVEAQSLGATFLETNRLPDAEDAFKRMVRLAPTDASGYANLALVYVRMGRWRDAESQAREALRRDTASVDAALLLAAVQQINGSRADARATLDRLARVAPSDRRVPYALVELARVNPDSAAARVEEREALERVVPLVPSNVAMRVELAVALSAASDADGALRELENLEQLPGAIPADARATFGEARLALRRRNPGATVALRRLRRVLETTARFQADIADLRGPQLTIAGVPKLTLPRVDAMRARLGRTAAQAVRFADASAMLPLTAPGAPGTGALAVGDFDGDDADDVFVSIGTDGRGQLLHAEGARWVDAASSAGVRVTGATAATFADLDNDGHHDLYVVDARGQGYLFRNNGKGRFTDLATTAGVASAGQASRVVAADLDHDGDLDLLLARDGGVKLYRNNGNGSYLDATLESGLAAPIAAHDVAFADLSDDGMLDVVAATDAGVRYGVNGRERRFEDRSGPADLPTLPAAAIAVADYDADGFFDLFVAGRNGEPTLRRNDHEGRFVRDMRAAATFATLRTLTVRAARWADFDNDGLLDLVLAGDPTPGTSGLRVFANRGDGRFADRTTELVPVMPAIHAIATLDLDHDRDEDLLVAGPAGTRFLRNDGGNANLSIQIRLTGLATGSGKNNAFGLGSRIEARVGDVFQSRTVTERVTSIGLGPHLKADVIRVEWPNGVPQTLYFPGSDQDVVENQVLKSSCGFLYAWNGERFEFVTDVMWRSALGMPVGIGGAGSGSTAYAPAGASEEYLKIPHGAMVAKDGRYRLQLTEELWETSYTDQVRLVAIDHPDSTDLVVDERFVPPGAPVHLSPFSVRRVRPPVSAVDDRGVDVLPLVRDADDRYVSDLDRDRYQGVTRPHDLIVDVGRDLGDGATLLLLRGWVFPTDASINVAMSQGGMNTLWPVLDVKDRNGAWRTIATDLSIPSGKNKLVVVDLTGRFPTADRRVRIRTSLQIYWDQVSVASGAGGTASFAVLAPAAADLHYRGFSRLYRKGGRYGPHWFAYDDVTKEPIWRPIDGAFTRFGDVTALLGAADDQYIIMAPGDETTIEFDASALKGLPPGWTRDFFLHSVGWIKDADLNTAFGGTVEPLPFHGIRAYPPGPGDQYPGDEAHQRYRESYNTRRMTRDGSLRPR